MSFNFETIFGEGSELINKKGEKLSIRDALNGKEVVAIYFSAHWCGPCRNFTPSLAKVYNSLVNDGKSFEIVFVSADSDEKSFQEYFGEMPWLALPYGEREAESDLSARFGCNGIPHLVLISGINGEEISREGRDVVDKCGAAGFPFTSEAIAEATSVKFNNFITALDQWKLLGLDGAAVDDLKSKEAVGLFFGNAIGDAQYVIPALQKAYPHLQDRLAVIYVSFKVPEGPDEEETKFRAAMPSTWVKLADTDGAISSAVKASLGGELDDPKLLVLDGAATRVLVEDACRTVYRHKEFGFPWTETAIAAAQKQERERVDAFKAETLGTGGLKFLAQGKLLRHGPADAAAEPVNLSDVVDNELVGIYFSAHWCGPCRSFTPKLKEAYEKMRAAGNKVEIVFVSSDEDQASFDEYWAEMPWLALDFADRDLKKLLSSAFDVDGIPTLVWADPRTGTLIADGRETINVGSEWFPWSPELFAQGKAALAKKIAQEKEEQRQRTLLTQQGFRDNNTVVLENHKGTGQFTADYHLTFGNFNTFIGDIKLPKGGKYYYEIEVKKLASVPQMGWMTEGFAKAEHARGQGVGDDNFSWGFDGMRQQKWGNSDSEDFGTTWSDGDMLGCAVDLSGGEQGDRKGAMSFSVNGSFDAPNGVAFEDVDVEWLSPALTAQGGEYGVNFGDRPFKHVPPDASYISVHDAKSLALDAGARQV